MSSQAVAGPAQVPDDGAPGERGRSWQLCALLLSTFAVACAAAQVPPPHFTPPKPTPPTLLPAYWRSPASY